MSGVRTLRRFGPTLSIAAMIGAWQIAIMGLRVPAYLVPAPSGIIIKAVQEWEFLAYHAWVTIEEVLIAFGASIALGIPLAMVIVYSPLLEHTIYPLLVSSQSVPKVAIAPLLIFWAGIGLLSKVLVAFMVAIFPVIVSSIVGLRATEPEMIYLARSMGAGEFRTFLKIHLPNALPSIFAGLKVAVTLAVVGAVVGEFIGADRGLGYVVLQANSVLDTDLSFAAIVVLSAIGIGMFYVIELLEWWLVPWQAARRGAALAETS
jgi:NitT/TauT family transport system permease protein